MAISQEIKDSFKKGSSLIKLIYINIGVFVAAKLFQVVFFLAGGGDFGSALIVNWFAVPSLLSELVLKPWTLITYMFLHVGFLHILFNLIWIYVFGQVFLQYWDQRKLVGVYLLGGLLGAGFFILAFNIFPAFQAALGSPALGASASAMAIAVAIAVYAPNYELYVFFLGPVKIKYIILFFIGLDVLSMASANAGGHIAHLGGAVLGYIYANKYRKGKDMTRGIHKILDGIANLFKKKEKIRIKYKTRARQMDDMEYNKSKAVTQQEMDRILDKIGKYGYESLTKQEKDLLFRMQK
jgi:membrane associated rhomboid family serine protease